MDIFSFLQRSPEVFTSKFSVGSKFLFNSEKLVIFGQPGNAKSNSVEYFRNKKRSSCPKAKLLLLKLIHLFARKVLLVKKLEIEETKTT
jgi:hypothetical protein